MTEWKELPKVVFVEDQPCQQLYEGNPVLLGYDMVEYHFIPSYREGGVAVQGLPEFAYNFEGYQFWFANEDNRELFRFDPWKYAPAFGGYCAWGISKETPPYWPWGRNHLGPPATPWEGWAIINGTLIFNIWASYTDRFLEEGDLNLGKAVRRWKSFHDGNLQAGPFNTHCLGKGPLENFCLGPQPNPWLEPLPQCINGTGGGIVSPYDEFDDFENAMTTPFGRKLAIGASTSFFICIFVGFFFHARRHGAWAKNSSVNTLEDDTEDHELRKQSI